MPRPAVPYAGIAVVGLVLGALAMASPRRPAERAESQSAPATPSGVEAAASSTPEPAPAAKKKHPQRACKVAAIGDSLTDARSHGGKFLRYLAERAKRSRFDNYGVGGNMVNQMRRRFARDVLGEPADPGAPKPRYTHLVVFGGVNDLYSDLTAGRNPSNIAEDLLYMYREARKRGMRVVAINVAPWGGYKQYYNESRGAATRKLNRWIMDQLDAGTVDYTVDAYKLLSCGDPERLCPEYAKPFKDGIHFGPQGHEALGKALYDAVFSDCL